jgi:tyrosyl-tRNA synthetase (EC 6.1.1.1)
LNVSDEDAEKYIKIFTALDKEEIEGLVVEQKAALISEHCKSVLLKK